MNVTPISGNTDALTPSALLAKFKQGERPKYEHKNDVLMDELNLLVEKYRQTMTISAKKNLIEHEKKIFLDGLRYPERTLARNYENVSKFITPNDSIPVEDALRLFDITGFYRLIRLSGDFKTVPTIDDIDILKKVYSQIDENTKIGTRAKNYILLTLADIKDERSLFKKEISRALLEMKEETSNTLLKDTINMSLDSKSIDTCLEELKKDYDNTNKLMVLLGNSKPNSNEEITDFVSTILKRKGVSYDTYEFAILGAGKFRSEENFEILKNIALKRADKGARFKELALHSLALYVKEKPEEVKEILSQVKKENSIYAELATILFDKVTGNYHNQENREYRYAKLHKKQIEKFKKNKAKILQLDVSLNKKQLNACDRFLLPFRKSLARLGAQGYRYIIQSDTFTKQHPELSGQRYFETGAGILNSGDFYDVFNGINTESYSMMCKYRVSPANHSNQTGHELGHAIDRFFLDTDVKTLDRLYKKALRENIVLDFYAAANRHEYFAQGVDAFISAYKPHKDILNNNPLAHTKYELLAKDPDLYKFVKKCLKKYC